MKLLLRIFFIVIYVALMGSLHLSAQERGTISGVVIDKETDETLPGAYVLIAGSQTGTTTDDMGFYKLRLPAGKQQVVAQFLGFRPDTVTVNIEPNKEIEVDFFLQSQAIQGEEILITSDRVTKRVKELASLRDQQRKNLENYSAQVHKLAIIYETVKGKTEKNKDSKEAEKLSELVEGEVFESSSDTLKPIAFSERVLEQLFIAPKTFAEKYFARRSSDNFFSEYDIFATGGSPLNLNDSKVELSILSEVITVIGPISENAGKHYELKDEPADSTWPEGTTKIIVKPKSNKIPLFVGSVYVSDEQNRVIGMNLRINEAGNVNSGLYSLTDFKYYQKYEKINDYWLPVRAEVAGKIGIIGMKNDFVYRDYWSYTDYKINRENLDKSDIPLSGEIVLDKADDRDSTFWAENVTYTQESDYQDLLEAQNYTEERKAINAGMSLFKAYFKAPYALRNFYITNVSDFYRFNKVEGHFLGAGIRTPSKNENFYYKAAGGYATDNEAQDWRYHFDALQFIPGTGLGIEGSYYKNLEVQFGDYEYDRNPLDIDEFRYSLIAGFSGFDPRNFFERDGFRFGLRYRFRPDFFLRVNYMREDHNFTPIVTTKSFFDEFEVGGRIDPNLNTNIGKTPVLPDQSDNLDGFTSGQFSGLQIHAHYDNRQFVREGLFRDYEIRKFGWFTDNLVYWSDPDFGGGDDVFEYVKYRHSFGTRIPVFRSHFMLTEFYIAGSDNPLPAQSQIGSNGFIIDTYLRRRPFITLGFNEGIGNRTSVARVDYDFGSGFFRIFPFKFIRQSGMQMRMHASAGYTHIQDGLTPVMPWTDGRDEHVEVGFAVTRIFGLFKLEAAFRVQGDRGEEVGFVLIL